MRALRQRLESGNGNIGRAPASCHLDVLDANLEETSVTLLARQLDDTAQQTGASRALVQRHELQLDRVLPGALLAIAMLMPQRAGKRRLGQPSAKSVSQFGAPVEIFTLNSPSLTPSRYVQQVGPPRDLEHRNPRLGSGRMGHRGARGSASRRHSRAYERWRGGADDMSAIFLLARLAP